MMAESHMLKILESEKHVCQVKEEIIVMDFSTNIIKDYFVMVEKARFSLKSLVEIWRSEE